MLSAMIMFHAIGRDAGADALAVGGASSAGWVWPRIVPTGVEDTLVDSTTGMGTAAAVCVLTKNMALCSKLSAFGCE